METEVLAGGGREVAGRDGTWRRGAQPQPEREEFGRDTGLAPAGWAVQERFLHGQCQLRWTILRLFTN